MKELRNESRDLTVQETCAVFRITPPTVYRMLAQGKLKGYTVGRARRITQESIQKMREGRS